MIGDDAGARDTRRGPIFQRYFSGDSWVGRESPVSSIDDRVTNAVRAGGKSE